MALSGFANEPFICMTLTPSYSSKKNGFCFLTFFFKHIYIRIWKSPVCSCVLECNINYVNITTHNQLHQLKQMHANAERNALHLQNKTACGERRGRRGLRETGEMSSILRDKSPALPSTACPWSSHCNRPHTGSESVTHCPWGAHTLECRNVSPQPLL